MRSRVSVTGSAAAGPSLRARRHNLNEPRKQSFPCFLRPPQALCQQAQNVQHGTATVDTVLAMVSRTASWRVSASIGWMNPPASRPASCSIVMIWTPLAFRLAASTRATWPASLVCTTTVRPAVMAISSTKDQANPNQLHSFVTSKPTTCPRPYCDERSLEVDLVCLDRAVPVAGCVESRKTCASASAERRVAEIPEATCRSFLRRTTGRGAGPA